MLDRLSQGKPLDPHVVANILDKVDQTALIISTRGDIIFANKFFFNTYGFTSDDIYSKKIYDDSLGMSCKERFEHAIEMVHAGNNSVKYELVREVPDGHQYHEITIISFMMDGIEELLFMTKDITELRRSQFRAAALNEMLKKIIDNLPVYLFVKEVDNDLRYMIWNRAFAEKSNIPAEKVLGKTDFEVFPDFRDAQAFRDDDLKVIETGEMTSKQETYMAADGRTRVVQTYKTLVHREDNGPLLVGISLDVTDIHGIEEELVHARLRAEESDRLKTQFLANMSHEIRTPLNAIVGFAGMLSDVEDEPTRNQFLDIINDNTELLLQLINDIIDLSKIEAGMLEYTRLPMDLYEMCNNLMPIYQQKLNPEVKLIFDNASNPHSFTIHEDRNRLIQVMENLLNNAIKFTKQGEIHYGYKVNDDNIEVYVSDTGKGMPADKVQTVFERFVKLDNFAQGSGLGLSICKLIVETLGGRIYVESEEGKGSTFRFTIPYVNDRKYNQTGIVEWQPLPKSEDDKDQTVLVVEDVNSNFLVVKTMIQGRYNVIWARDGQEGIKLAREKNPDLILMDIKMPNMDGIEATREIRKFNSHVPIVALTAHAFDDNKMLALHVGMNNFLPKPINRDAFEVILSTYLTPSTANPGKKSK